MGHGRVKRATYRVYLQTGVGRPVGLAHMAIRRRRFGHGAGGEVESCSARCCSGGPELAGLFPSCRRSSYADSAVGESVPAICILLAGQTLAVTTLNGRSDDDGGDDGRCLRTGHGRPSLKRGAMPLRRP
jgi:hypothetical protein